VLLAPTRSDIVHIINIVSTLVVRVISVITLHHMCVLVGDERIKASLPVIQRRHDSDSGQREAFDLACKVRSDLDKCDCVKWLHTLCSFTEAQYCT
jgi:hypothetical protein